MSLYSGQLLLLLLFRGRSRKVQEALRNQPVVAQMEMCPTRDVYEPLQWPAVTVVVV